MGLVKCPNGHYYDNEKHEKCPHCRQGFDLSKAMGGAASSKMEGVTVALGSKNAGDEVKTVSYYSLREKEAAKSCDPVVGWLVCKEGAEKGRDYRLHAGRNFIGRSASADINIFDDAEVSRSNHSSLVYDPKNNEFAVLRGENASILRNGKPVMEAEYLSDGDELTIGGSLYVFVAYCREGRKW